MILVACEINNKHRPLVFNLNHMLGAEPFGNEGKPLTQITMIDGQWHLLLLPFSDFISILRVKGNQHFYDARPKEAQNERTTE